jgi:hypothetical protein
VAQYSSSFDVDSSITTQSIFKVFNSVGDIQEGARPASASIAYPSVLNTTSDDCARRELYAEMTDMIQVILDNHQPP